MKTSLDTSEETMTNAGVAQLVEPLIYDQRAGVRVPPPAPYGLEVENVLLRTLWVKRNVGLAHHRNH